MPDELHRQFIAGIHQARFHHLSYEQMDDWVEDRLEPSERELVMAHIGVCPACARQLIAYQEYAPAMAAPIRAVPPAVVQKSIWAYFKQPHYALAAAAVLAFFVITPFTRHSAPPESPEAILAPAAVDSKLPESSAPLKEEVLKSDPGAIEYPRVEAAETLPVFKWKAFGDSYALTLYDARHNMIARRAGLTATEWTPSSPLTRGAAYSWEVESGTQRYRATFRVR